MYLLVWVNNSFAYIFGRKWGKKLLFPNVSPNKTWEGCLGGTLMCLLVGFILISYYPKYHMLTFPFLALIISATSVIGDLIQSKFKRQAAIKDSGYIIPGHGGFYDRMDSVLFTAPFVYLFFILLDHVS